MLFSSLRAHTYTIVVKRCFLGVERLPAGREHHYCVQRRPRRHAWGARIVVQNVLFRALRTRAFIGALSTPFCCPPRHPKRLHTGYFTHPVRPGWWQAYSDVAVGWLVIAASFARPRGSRYGLWRVLWGRYDCPANDDPSG